jgi:hypothetical protein
MTQQITNIGSTQRQPQLYCTVQQVQLQCTMIQYISLFNLKSLEPNPLCFKLIFWVSLVYNFNTVHCSCQDSIWNSR